MRRDYHWYLVGTLRAAKNVGRGISPTGTSRTGTNCAQHILEKRLDYGGYDMKYQIWWSTGEGLQI
jgi:hypothetical protein